MNSVNNCSIAMFTVNLNIDCKYNAFQVNDNQVSAKQF